MEFYVDTADLDIVREINECYPIEGFTTNPNILPQAKRPLDEVFAGYRAFVEETGLAIFVQVTARDAEGMVRQARALSEYFGKTLVVKVPATREGYRACRLCKGLGLRVCVTVVHSIMQGIVAAKAGAGCQAVTLAPAMFDMLIAHPATDMSLQGFDQAWRGRFGDRQVTDFLPKA